MSPELAIFAARLREFISLATTGPQDGPQDDQQFNELALTLFALQFKHNSSYRKLCEARGLTPETVREWRDIPAVPSAAFKEFEMTCIPAAERTAVFHSSGTTEQVPSRHFHCVDSLVTYEASLWAWFERNVLTKHEASGARHQLMVLTPLPEQVPHSSLVHMFEVVRKRLGQGDDCFLGELDAGAAWTLDFSKTVQLSSHAGRETPSPKLLLGTAFSFVHLLDFLAEKNLRLTLPAGSRVMETGGYKNRSRSMPKAELHALITKYLGVPAQEIICEYGMSELSSQGYDGLAGKKGAERRFHFPPWARVRIVSPETGREVAEGETGLVRIFDLANVYSVMALQTEDLGIRRGIGFELIGRSQLAEARGCSLMTA